jgi:NitT/TauT family transport system substrate-binding protein
MRAQYAAGWTRRAFLGGLTLAGTTGLLGLSSRRVGAEPPPETTTLKPFQGAGGVCIAPQHVAEEFLQGEGFTEVHYVQLGHVQADQALASAEIHLTMGFVGNVITQVDASEPIAKLSGGHVGCFELFAAG